MTTGKRMSMNEPIVTVVVPVYNTEKYLHHCLDALSAQTLGDIRVVCVDDGSTDTSGAILDEFANNDSRFEVIHKPNSGYGASMNRGFAAATTKYVGIVEPDDFPAADMLEKLVTLAESTDADVVKSNYYSHICGQDQAEDELVKNLDENLPYGTAFAPDEHHRLLRASASVWSCLYRRQYLVDNNIHFLETPGASFQDTSFNLTALMAAKRVALTAEGFLHYRTDNAASSVKSGAKIFYICDEYERVWNYLAARPGLYAEFGKDIAAIQFKGYCWNQWRLARKFREQFFNRFRNEFLGFEEKGLLEKSLYSDYDWNDLDQLLHSPNTFFMRACGARGIKRTVIVTVPSDVSAATFEKFLNECPSDEEIIVDFPDGASFDIWPIAEKDLRIKVLSEMCPEGNLDDSDVRGDAVRKVELHESKPSAFAKLFSPISRKFKNR